jgi:hypothetical protein
MGPRAIPILAAAVALLSAFSCSQTVPVDAPDVDVEPPSAVQLDLWQREYDEGTTWRGDPKRVAHEEIQLRLDVPWKGESLDPSKYEFTERNSEKPHWGSYVIRRYTDRSGRHVSYQVQLARHKNVWYARKVRHYYGIDVPHPALQDHGPVIK